MDDCQHFPVRITREPQGATATALIRCERCKIETNPIIWNDTGTNRNQLWNEWAQLMAKESDGRRARLEKAAAAAPGFFSERQSAMCWEEFLRGAGLSTGSYLSTDRARQMGVNYKEAALVKEVLRRNLKAPVTPQRLTDIFVLFRKATRAFHMWGVLTEPEKKEI